MSGVEPGIEANALGKNTTPALDRSLTLYIRIWKASNGRIFTIWTLMLGEPHGFQGYNHV